MKFSFAILLTILLVFNHSALFSQLKAQEAAFLNDLNKNYFVNPIGKKRVHFKCASPTCWGSDEIVWSYGWLEQSTKRIYFNHGDYIALKQADSLSEINFIDSCKKVYSKEIDLNEPWGVKSKFDSWNLIGADDLTLAAWLHKMGKEDLAVKALERDQLMWRENPPQERPREDSFTRYKKREIKSIRENLLWSYYDALINNYIIRRDSLAFAYGKRLKELTDTAYYQSKEIMADLQRRRQNKTFGKEPDSIPTQYETWNTGQKVSYLIQALDEFDARQAMQPGGIFIDMEWEFTELVKIGEPAIPELIKVIESDMRLTRCVTFWRDFSHDRHVWGVWEVANNAVQQILQSDELKLTFDERNENDQSKNRKILAERIRTYYEKYKGVSYEDRFVQIIKDTLTGMTELEEAVVNVSKLSPHYYKGNIYYMGISREQRQKDSLVWLRLQKKYENPTVAELILKAFDRALANGSKGSYYYYSSMNDYRKRDLTRIYLLNALVDFHDTRIVPELVKRYNNETIDITLKRRYAYAAFQLGDSTAILDYAKQMEAGKFTLGAYIKSSYPHEVPVFIDIFESIYYLKKSNLPGGERMAQAIANPNHPYYASWKTGIQEASRMGGYEESYFFCRELVLPLIIEQALDKGNERQRAVCRVLSNMVHGFPDGTYGLPDWDLKDCYDFLNRFKNFRQMTTAECSLSQHWPQASEMLFIPVINLNYAATQQDVDEGRAIFHLNGKGKKVEMKLPASAKLKKDEKDNYTARVLIYQAEEDENGQVFYGIIAKNEIKMVKAEELVDIKPIE